MVGSEQEKDFGGDETGDIRAQLKLAQERLATYQKFDRDIAENVRRSSELMLEAMQVRDRMDRDASDQAKARQERLVSQLNAMQADLEHIQGQVGTMLGRVTSLQDEIGAESVADSADEADDDIAAESVDPATSLVAEDASFSEVESLAPGDDEPEASAARSIELIAHGMTRAASALALQSHLRGLSQVDTVDAREFSSGILRLQLSLSGDLPDDDLMGWEGDDEMLIVRHQDDAIELRLGE